ncbi:c-type cytochrome [Pontibacter silvestris]|uniref:C-type cytochrome n=1 Tax=Pontibacter silvestris TaxID=2305183 RepID=A0ABW4X3Z9_9BACT|nr:c-type cytochrome [Pontibacter silvestris]MCC9137174.1 c-type cytochrome [Pontibacter silvestris]
MPITAFLHAHVLIVISFLMLFITKAILLLLNKWTALTKIRSKTNIPDIVFGTLIVITGSYLVFQYNGSLPTWLIVKFVLVLAAVPFGIVGIKRNDKILTVLALLTFLYVYGITETQSLALTKPGSEANATSTPDKIGSPATEATDAAETGKPIPNYYQATEEEILSSVSEKTLANAKAIYVQACANCHGENGTKGLGGAADLSISQLSLNSRKNVIQKGCGLMPAFGSKLREQEIEALAAYTLTLKK